MNNIRVLLVDDSPAFLRALESLLKSWGGIDVVGSTRTGDIALELISTLHPDLILVDLHMPGMDGLATTRQIKRGTEAPFVFLMTLHDEPGFRQAATDHGADAFVCKPEFPSQLLPLIQQFFGRP